MLITRGYFSSNRVTDSVNMVNEAFERIRTFSERSIRSASGTMVFISHKHDDLEDLQGFISYMHKEYNIIPYIDSMDKGMPKNTCAETATRIKSVIANCQKFILLGTNKALLSKWCNWEVGIADKTKLPSNNMAILPMLDDNSKFYFGNEYLEIYPYIEEITDIHTNRRYLAVNIHTDKGFKRILLKDWLNNINL